MAVRLKDVAEAAGVSITLVSNYVNGKATARMSDGTRNRIDKALRDLDYQPNPAARLLRTGAKSRTVGILTAGIQNEVNNKTLLLLHENFLENGYNALIAYTKNELGLLRKSCQELSQAGCAGLILHSQNWNVDCTPLPQVVVSADMRKNVPNEVFCDYRPAIEALLDHLVSLGHKRILYLTLGNNSTRRTVYEERFPGEKVLKFSSTDAITPEVVRQILKEHPGATAAACSNDLLALALSESLKKLGYRIPEDFSVTGFDNTALSKLCGLTTVDQVLEERCSTAVTALVGMIEKQQTFESCSIPARFIVRNSCSKMEDS